MESSLSLNAFSLLFCVAAEMGLCQYMQDSSIVSVPGVYAIYDTSNNHVSAWRMSMIKKKVSMIYGAVKPDQARRRRAVSYRA